jgi:DNA invertase Pin-like site-specific DNA recombinase
MLAVIGPVGQAEGEAMLERQREGIAKAKAQGRRTGRVPTVRRRAAEIIRLKEEGVRPSEIVSRLRIGRASVYGVLANHTGENGHAMVVTPPVHHLTNVRGLMEGREKDFRGSNT